MTWSQGLIIILLLVTQTGLLSWGVLGRRLTGPVGPIGFTGPQGENGYCDCGHGDE